MKKLNYSRFSIVRHGQRDYMIDIVGDTSDLATVKVASVSDLYYEIVDFGVDPPEIVKVTDPTSKYYNKPLRFTDIKTAANYCANEISRSISSQKVLKLINTGDEND